jgi:hypothetical protein
MLLSLETDLSLDYLKLTAEQKLKHLFLPSSAAKRLKEIIEDDQINIDDFVKELQAIEASVDNLSWKVQTYLHKLSNHLADQIQTISFVYLIVAIFLIFGLLFFYKKVKSEKKLAPLRKAMASIIIRFSAMLAYLPPIICLYSHYMPSVVKLFPEFFFLMPGFIELLVQVYDNIKHVEYIYFFSVVWIVIGRRWPRNRFIRFHIVKGLLLFTMQHIPFIIYQISFGNLEGGFDQIPLTRISLFCLLLNLFWILPGLWEGLTLTYPKYYPLRESIELNLGRDDTDNFKWWDRKK